MDAGDADASEEKAVVVAEVEAGAIDLTSVVTEADASFPLPSQPQASASRCRRIPHTLAYRHDMSRQRQEGSYGHRHEQQKGVQTNLQAELKYI